VPETRRIDHQEIETAIQRLASAILARPSATGRLFLLGIANGGMELAKRLGRLVPGSVVGTLDISFHRDDIGHHPIPKEFSPTVISGDVNGAEVILVDDVLFSGRTVKAALDELFDHGRPDQVRLAVLVDRGGRKLPIAPDFCAISVSTTPGEKVIVTLDPVASTKDSIVIRSGP
jgi:pyrimidine operon attenuation protein / uracil phosphoribosyltransferase